MPGPVAFLPVPPRRSIGVIAMVVAVAIVAAACGSSTAATSAPPPTTSPVADTPSSPAPRPDQPGPFAVGRRTITVTDPNRPQRPLTVDVWYPADAASVSATPFTTYTFLPGVQFDSTVAHADAALASGGPYPFVVYSHGSGGFRWVATYFTELLASHGFVVASADHTGDTATDQVAGTDTTPEQNALDRPADAHAEIDALLTHAATAGDPLRGAVDPARIGMAGHSFGGFTAITAAAGYQTVPPDPRIKAVLAQAPYTRPIPADVLQRDTVPTMIITGTLDTTTPIATDTVRPWELIPGRPLFRVDVTGMAHLQFTDVCAYPALLAALPTAPPQVIVDLVSRRTDTACTPAYLDITRAHEVTNTFGVAFLERYVAGDTSVEPYLTASYASTVPEVAFSEKP